MSRQSVRILLLNPENRLLLMRIVDPTTTGLDKKPSPAFWCTIGGSLQPGETKLEALARELQEETGLTMEDIKLGPEVWHGKHKMYLNDILTDMEEFFFVAHTKCSKISSEGFTENEKMVVTCLAWISHKEILSHYEEIYPAALYTHLPAIIQGDYPYASLEINLSALPPRQ